MKFRGKIYGSEPLTEKTHQRIVYGRAMESLHWRPTDGSRRPFNGDQPKKQSVKSILDLDLENNDPWTAGCTVRTGVRSPRAASDTVSIY